MGNSATIGEMLETVYYCKSCHSLRVLTNPDISNDDWDGSYCGVCQSTDIGECTIGEWLEEEKRMKRAKREREWRR